MIVKLSKHLQFIDSETILYQSSEPIFNTIKSIKTLNGEISLCGRFLSLIFKHFENIL